MTAVFLTALIAAGSTSIAWTSAESAAVTQLVRRGVGEAPGGFARFSEGTVAALGGKFLTCHVSHDWSAPSRPASWELVCRSRPHSEKVENLAAVVKRAVSAGIPKYLDQFSQDDDSIGDLTLGWQHSPMHPVAVYATVSAIWKTGHDASGTFGEANGSDYVLHVTYTAYPAGVLKKDGHR